MFKYLLCILVVVLVFLVVHMSISKLSGQQENFQVTSADVDFNAHPDLSLRNQLSSQLVNESDTGASAAQSGSRRGNSGATYGNNDSETLDLEDYVLKSDIERAARASTQKYCPVPPDYNPSNYIKKSEIDFAQACPKMPDLKDYVLKSTIPPVQKCPACICPKVKVSAGMCKECPKPKNNCPKCEPCGVEQCRDVIKCAPGDQQVSCPKCPAPQPCPEPPEKVCPAFELPRSDIECPAPKPCPLPGPCPDGEGRCPEKPDSKCKYYGIKEIAKERSVNDLVNEMLLSDDPKLKELLSTLKHKLDINLSAPPTQKAMLKPTIASVTDSSFIPNRRPTQAIYNEVMNNSPPIPSTMPAPAPTTGSSYKPFNPGSHNNAEEEYTLDNYRLSSINMGAPAIPEPTFNSNVGNTAINGASNMGCDINDGNCAYNTNLNI